MLLDACPTARVLFARHCMSSCELDQALDVCIQAELHVHVMQLKNNRAERSEIDAARSSQTLQEAEMQPAPALPSTPMVAVTGTGQIADAPVKEGPQQLAHNVPDSDDAEMATLDWGVAVRVPKSPPATGSFVKRLFGCGDDASFEGAEQLKDGLSKATTQKRKREGDPAGAETASHKAVHLAVAGNAPIPAWPKRGEVPPGKHRAGQSAAGRFSEDVKPRMQGGAVFSGVRGASGPERRAEKGAFVGRAASGHEQGGPRFGSRWRPDAVDHAGYDHDAVAG
jgi:hypothetical protein